MLHCYVINNLSNNLCRKLFVYPYYKLAHRFLVVKTYKYGVSIKTARLQ